VPRTDGNASRAEFAGGFGMKVLVTGGSRGIGKDICKVFLEHGHTVLAPTRTDLDLLKRDSIARFIEKYKDYGIDSIINNAGINPLNPIDAIKESDLDECITVNLIAPALLVKGLIGHMKANKKGYIVNIGSVWGVVSKEKRAVYSMTKNGIHGLTNTLAVELGPFNILANTVCPGFTKTELTSKNVSEKEERELCTSVPLRRFAMPEEIAKLVYFLGSEQNTYITGQKIVIDGGFSIQ
jgi:3-oxoacyl-[acyl-carrier protein] reductase